MNFHKILTYSIRYCIISILIVLLFSACAKKRNYTGISASFSDDYPVRVSEREETTDTTTVSKTTEVEQEKEESKETYPTIEEVDIPVITQIIPSQLLKRYAYTISYNKATRCPNWVAWKLTAEHTDGPYNRNEYKFHEDMDVPSPRAYYHDYSRNGIELERGHMCPAGDNKWSDRAMEECHLLSNICPQNGDLNGREWKHLEEDCREWAKSYNCIYIVCGPIFYSKKHQTIGEDKISVPDAFFKVVLRLGKSPQALGFIYPNRSCSGGKSAYVLSVDEVEKVTGMNFFSALDDKVEDNVERRSNLQLWN